MAMRRDFLKLCGMVGLTLACPGGVRSLLAASTKEDAPYDGPYYVVFNASGGWDTTYLMDPKGIGEINRLYHEGDATFMTATLPARTDTDDLLMWPVTFVLFGSKLITVRYHEPRAFKTFPQRAEQVSLGC